MEENLLEQTKLLLDIDGDTKDKLIELLIGDVINMINSYCRTDTVPQKLMGLIPQLAARLYTHPSVKIISEGERKIEYFSSSSLLDEYRKRLDPFVDKSARVPSDLD